MMVLSTIIIISLAGEIKWAVGENPELSLIGNQNIWQPFAATIVTQNQSSLDILVVTNYTGMLWNRAYLPLQIGSPVNYTVVFDLDYISKSYVGNATLFAEIRDNISKEVLWNNRLNNTQGQSFNQSFTLPHAVLNKPVEFRFYVITNEPGEHGLSIRKALLSFSNLTQQTK